MKLIIDIPEEYKEKFVKNKCDDLFNSLATNEFGYVLRKSFETATLETQPCEDCTVMKKLSKKYYVEDAYGYTDEDIVNKVNEIIDVVNELSSVTPTRPTGKWIVYDVVKFGDFVGTEKYECSKCHHRVGVFKSNFCPNCGCRMKGGE